MKDNKIEKNKIGLGELYQKGVHYEDVCNFENSIFSDVYKRAADCVKKIVRDNKRMIDGEWSLREKKKREPEIANAISFIGRRGTGKTSSLLSFSEALERYSCDRNDLLFGEKAHDWDDVRFFSLSCIDASILEESEKVFVLVLANMLKRLEQKDERIGQEESYTKQKLIRDLEKVYEEFRDLRENLRSRDERLYSSYEELKNTVSSQSIRHHFSVLVKKYLEYLSLLEYRKGKDAYLVITIDDLDMSHYNTQEKINPKSYEIMNTIQKYLSVPRVIVLVSYNDENLLKQCVNFISKSNVGLNPVKESESRYFFEGNATIANEFIQKVFVPIYRIYMPAWQMQDLEKKRVEISLRKDSFGDRLFAKYMGKGRYILTVKDFILILFAIKTGVYYDPLGRKRHFLETDSLRQLNSMFRLLVDNEDEFELEQNIEKLIGGNSFVRVENDLYFRFIREKLCISQERERFIKLLELPIDRRCQSIVNEISNKIQPLGRDVESRIEELEQQRKWVLEGIMYGNVNEIDSKISAIKNNEDRDYSFAELLHCIYCMTRDELYTKEYVACILHTNSFCLTKIYWNYHMDKCNFDKKKFKDFSQETNLESYKGSDKEEYDRIINNHNILKNTIGKSVCGRWAEYLFPLVKTTILSEMKVEAVSIAYVSTHKFNYERQIKPSKEDCKKAIEEIIILISLQTNLYEWSELKVDLPFDNNGKVSKLEVSSDCATDFDLTAFIGYAFSYHEYLKKLEFLLINIKMDENKKQERKEFLTIWGEAVKESLDSLWQQYIDWDWEYGNLMIPIHNFDLAYNMIKRLYEAQKEQNKRVFNIDERGLFFEEYIKMLSNFVEYLEKVDNFYCLQDERGSFTKVFTESPFIKMIDSLKLEDSKEESKKYLNERCINIERQMNSLVAEIASKKQLDIAGDQGLF